MPAADWNQPISDHAGTVAAADHCRHVRWGAIGILWVFALWHSWEVRALFNDGAVFFIAAVHQQSPVHFYGARDYAMLAMQFPLTLALWLGVTDLSWLARLLSFGMFAVPTAIYHLALVRAREDAALLDAVIIAIAAIFMTTSFSIRNGTAGRRLWCAFAARRLRSASSHGLS